VFLGVLSPPLFLPENCRGGWRVDPDNVAAIQPPAGGHLGSGSSGRVGPPHSLLKQTVPVGSSGTMIMMEQNHNFTPKGIMFQKTMCAKNVSPCAEVH
jgi:hypothetical protein